MRRLSCLVTGAVLLTVEQTYGFKTYPIKSSGPPLVYYLNGATKCYSVTSPDDQKQKNGVFLGGLRRAFGGENNNKVNLLDAQRKGGLLEARDPIPYQIKYQSNTRIRTSNGEVRVLGEAEEDSSGVWNTLKDAIWDQIDGNKALSVRPPKPYYGYGDLVTPSKPPPVERAPEVPKEPPQKYSLGLTPGARILLQQQEQQRASRDARYPTDLFKTATSLETANRLRAEGKSSIPAPILRQPKESGFAAFKDSIYDRIDALTKGPNAKKKQKSQVVSPILRYNIKAGTRPLQTQLDEAKIAARRKKEEQSEKFSATKDSLYDAVENIPAFAKFVAEGISDTAATIAATPEQVQKSIKDLQKSIDETQRIASVVSEDVQTLPYTVKAKVKKIQDTMEDINQSVGTSIDLAQRTASQLNQTVVTTVDKVQQTSENIQITLGLKEAPPPPPPPKASISERSLGVASTFVKATAKLSFVIGSEALKLGWSGAKWAIKTAVETSEEAKRKEATAAMTLQDMQKEAQVQKSFSNLLNLEAEVDEALRLAEEALREVNMAVQATSNLEVPVELPKSEPVESPSAFDSVTSPRELTESKTVLEISNPSKETKTEIIQDKMIKSENQEDSVSFKRSISSALKAATIAPKDGDVIPVDQVSSNVFKVDKNDYSIILDSTPSYSDKVITKDLPIRVRTRNDEPEKGAKTITPILRKKDTKISTETKRSWLKRLFGGKESTKEAQKKSDEYFAANNKRRFSLRGLLGLGKASDKRRKRKPPKVPSVIYNERFSRLDESIQKAISAADETTKLAEDIKSRLKD